MFEFTVTPDGGEAYDIVATSRDVLMWERTTKGASFAQLESNLRLVDLYAIAYRAALRLGHFDGHLSDFETSVDLDLLAGSDDEEGDEGVDPTLPAPTAGPSSPSPSTPASPSRSGRKKPAATSG
jgi:hypothetical protein